MPAPSVARSHSSSSPQITPTSATLRRVETVSNAAAREAANDDATAPPHERRLNPLWAVNAAMAAFFIVVALLLASD